MCQTLWCRTCIPPLHGHGALRMGAAYSRRLLAVPGNDADALVNLACDVFRSAGLQERDATRLARGEDPLTGVLHLRRIRLTGYLLIAQDEPQVTRAHFGKAKARHTQDLLDIRH